MDSRRFLCIPGCRRLPMCAARCANIHVAMALLSTSSTMETNSRHTRVTKFKEDDRVVSGA